MSHRKFANILALRMPIILILFAFFSASAWAQQEQKTPTPQLNLESLDIPRLIQTSDRNGAAMHQRLLEFTYIQKRISREVGTKGKVIERVREFEAYPVKTEGRHRHILSLIKKDGVPVSPEQIKENRLFAAAEMEKTEEQVAPSPSPDKADAERYITAGIGIGPNNEGVWLSVSQFLRQCRFEAPRLAQLDGREMIALTLRTCDSAPGESHESYLAKMTGTVWIDAGDKVVVRLEAWPMTASGTERSKNIVPEQPANEIIVYEQQRVQGGIWAPLRIRLNGIGKAADFNGVGKDMIFEFTDYRHFSTEVKETEAVDPKKKPIPF